MTLKFQFPGFTALCALTLLVSSCGPKANPTVQKDESEPNAPLVSSLKMNAATANQQLTKGVSQLESGAWRWTAGHFTIELKTPSGAAAKGATLTLNLTASPAVLSQVHSQTLTAAVGSHTLKTEKFVEPGAHTFTADVPASLLTGDTVAIDFSLDNSLPPSPNDRRELGVILTAASLDSK